MASPLDILQIPSYIENFVKTCRAIKEYRELDATHRALMERAIENSIKLKHLTSYIGDSRYYSETTWEYIEQLTIHAKLSMDRTLNVAVEWKKRLGIEDEQTSRLSRLKRLASSFAICIGKKGAIATMDEVVTKDGEKSPDEKSSDEKPSVLRKQVAKAQYMIVGKIEIVSSMDSLERWLHDLNLAILTSDRLSAKQKDAYEAPDNIEFVVRAKERISENLIVNHVDGEVLGPSTLSDIDPEANTGIYRVHSGEYTGCIVDPRDVESYAIRGEGELAMKETMNIARLFAEDTTASESQLSSTVGILPCCGYTELESYLHGIIFRYPPGFAHPRTLRSLLLEGDVKHSLHDRVQFATQLATSVLVIHSLGLVHKNIKPDAILVAESMVGDPKKLYPYKLGTPFLLSFDSSRSSRGPTMKGLFPYPGGANWATLYTHPRHFGWRQYKYQMRDDVFSLGVCLLEIALWRSLFRWNPTKGKYEDNTDVIDISPPRLRREARLQGKPNNVDKTWFRQYLLIEAAEMLVPPIMGDLFKDVIVGCLTFGDPGRLSKSDVFTTTFEDNKNLPPDDQSVCFVREVLTRLNGIKLS